MQGASWLKRVASRTFMPVGKKVAGLREAGEKPGILLLVLNFLGDLLVFRKVRDSLGLTHARVCYSCGATLAPDVIHFFHALGVPLKNVYGSAEAGAVTGVAGGVQKRGTVGSVNPGVEVKLGDRGEIMVRGAGTFLGYQNDPVATAHVLRDGWVCTGDRCEIKDGDLVFVDRLEDLILMPCGDEVAPQDIESPAQVQPIHPGGLGLRRTLLRLPLGRHHRRSGQHRALGRQAEGQLHDLRRPRPEAGGLPASSRTR